MCVNQKLEYKDSRVFMCAAFILLCVYRKMTFGKVNELGQFIRESEPEPDAKKSKGAVVLSLSPRQTAFTVLYLTSVCREKH